MVIFKIMPTVFKSEKFFFGGVVKTVYSVGRWYTFYLKNKSYDQNTIIFKIASKKPKKKTKKTKANLNRINASK